MRNAMSISRDGWERTSVVCPPNIMKGMRKACIDADIVPSQLFITLLNMVASGDVKLAVNPQCRGFAPASYMKSVEANGDFDVARVKITTLDGIAVNPTPFSNKDI